MEIKNLQYKITVVKPWQKSPSAFTFKDKEEAERNLAHFEEQWFYTLMTITNE